MKTKSLWKKYNEATFDGTMLKLIEGLNEKELLQLYTMTGNEEIGLEIDKIKGKL